VSGDLDATAIIGAHMGGGGEGIILQFCLSLGGILSTTPENN
jgi:hypothetical protein